MGVNRIVELLERAEGGSQVAAVEQAHILEDVASPRRDSDVTAWVNAIYGCNERCTYCVVPQTRGQEQSRHPDAIRVPPPPPHCALGARQVSACGAVRACAAVRNVSHLPRAFNSTRSLEPQCFRCPNVGKLCVYAFARVYMCVKKGEREGGREGGRERGGGRCV